MLSVTDRSRPYRYLLPTVARDLAQTQQLGYVGSLMRQVILNVHKAYHPILLRYGMDQEVLDEWSRIIEEGV